VSEIEIRKFPRHERRTAMWNKAIARSGIALAAAVALAGAAAGQDIVKAA